MVQRNRGKYTISGKHIIDTSTIFQKGKTHVPISVRIMIGVDEGDKLVWIFESGRIYVEPSIKLQ